MSGVISITEDTRGLEIDNEVDELSYVMSTARKFDLIFASDTDPVQMPIIAMDIISVSGSVATIPVLWDTHPYDAWAYVIKKKARSKGGYNWEVVCEYTRLEEPLEIPYRLSYGYSITTESIDKDKDDKPITNSSLETPDPPLTEEFMDLVMHFETNWPAINPVMMAEYGKKPTVNSDYFHGYEPGTCLIKTIEAQETRVAGLTYYAVTIEIHMRAAGWKRRYLDEGYRIIVKENGVPKLDDDGNVVFETIKDEDGNPLTSPVMLDGTGSRLADGEDPVYLERETKQSLPFSVLNVG